MSSSISTKWNLVFARQMVFASSTGLLRPLRGLAKTACSLQTPDLQSVEANALLVIARQTVMCDGRRLQQRSVEANALPVIARRAQQTLSVRN